MPLSDIPIATLVALFLAVFVLIGIQPALKRTAIRLRRWIAAATPAKEILAPSRETAHAALFESQSDLGALNDFEIIVLRRIAQARGKSLSRKEVNAPLLFGDAVLHRTLSSLLRRRLVTLRFSAFGRPRFLLTETGRRYALEQGYLVAIQERQGLL